MCPTPSVTPLFGKLGTTETGASAERPLGRNGKLREQRTSVNFCYDEGHIACACNRLSVVSDRLGAFVSGIWPRYPSETKQLRIALLEDDPAQAELLHRWFVSAKHRCYRFENAGSFLRAIHRESFDLVVIDWGLPDIPGDEVLERLRGESKWRVPVLFITSRDREEDIVHALEKGADDYMVKPVKRAETLARLAALARRAATTGDEDQIISLGDYRIDSKRRAVTCGTTVFELTQKEYELALFLFRNVGRLLSRGYILENVWGRRPDLNTRTVDTHVSRIRAKLRLTPDNGWRLTAVYQHGYRLERLEPLEGKG